MPTALRSGQYRVYFYSHDLLHEPPHVHVDREDVSAKFWLDPVSLAHNYGFGASELRRVARLVEDHETELLEVWSDSVPK